MKIIPLGSQCSVPEALKITNLRKYSYPFDWLLSPSKTTYEILTILLTDGVEKTISFMTENYKYYKCIKNEEYSSSNVKTENQLNKETGLGITFFNINDDYKIVLKIRLERLLKDILSQEKLLLIYADYPSITHNYTIDNIVYGTDATEYLEKIYNVISKFNSNVEILYYCWPEREKPNKKIKHIPFEYKSNWYEVSRFIAQSLVKLYEHDSILY